MECTRRLQATENADEPLPRWEIAWRIGRALVVAAAVGMALWGGPFRPSPGFRYARACHLLSSNPAWAARLFQSLVDDDGGDFPDAQLQLALQAIRRGEWGKSETLCSGLDWQHVDSDLLLTLGAEALSAGRTELARQSFGELRQRDTCCKIAGLQGLAHVFELEHRPDEALQCLVETTRIVPENAHFWRVLAEAFAARQNPVAAADAYRQVLRQNLRRRDKAEIHRRLIAQLIDAGDAAGAREELEKLISSDDNLAPETVTLVERVDRLASESVMASEARP